MFLRDVLDIVTTLLRLPRNYSIILIRLRQLLYDLRYSEIKQ